MEKILLIIDAHKPSVAAIDFAAYMATIAQTKLTGLFIENTLHKSAATEIESPYFVYTKPEDTIVTVDVEQGIRIFKEQCVKNNVLYDVVVDTGEPIQKVLYESRYADLLIMDPDINFYEMEQELPSYFVKSILMNAECSVMLAPADFTSTEEIAFCFDGSSSSVFAIKQFTYLLPEFAKTKAVLLEVKDSEKETFTEKHIRMMDWLRSHYKTVYYHILKGDVKEELFSYFFMKRNKIIVMGAYGRSLLSTFFRKSNADPLIRSIDLPLFITHY